MLEFILALPHFTDEKSETHKRFAQGVGELASKLEPRIQIP